MTATGRSFSRIPRRSNSPRSRSTRAGPGRPSADGRIVGFATLLGAELEDLFVDPAWMRRGIGRALLLDAVAVARAQGLERVEVTANPHALPFYERVGFVPDGTVETDFGPGTRMHRDC